MKKGKKVAKQYFNRELSWLAFNRRVLNLCSEPTFPLLERLRFLSIVSNNLDEFFEVRVAGLEQQLESGVLEVGFDGLGPREQLRRISAITTSLTADEYTCWNDELIPALKAEKIYFKTPKECTLEQRNWLKTHFENSIYPALTPMSIDPAHPFPHLRNKGLYVLLTIGDISVKRSPSEFAIIPVPPILQRIIKMDLKKDGDYFVYLSDTIKYFAEQLFPGYRIRSSSIFRITRNSDLYYDEEETENLLMTIENELHNRRKGAAVRLEIEESVTESSLRMLVDALDIDENFVFKIPSSPLNLARLAGAYDLLERPDLKFSAYKQKTPPEFKSGDSMFELISQKDRFLHHPYDSFKPVEKFIGDAAKDENVLAIKLTLYRTNKGSPILNALKQAARAGKQVTVLVELKARFDEENNIQWARELEDDGVHVVYGIVGLKTHCKTCLVVRKELDGQLKRYVHLGTGNYNSKTAKIYTDLSFFTAREDITFEVANLFNALTGRSKDVKFDKLMVAPYCFHSKFIELINREIEHAKAGKSAKIIIKANSVVEQSTIDALYEASQAGVQIEMIVRGICVLTPSVKGLSENITVRSIVGVYLEHSRIYYFHNDGDPTIYVGSGDIMSRNMFRRIECLYPVEDADIKERIVSDILPSMLKDNMFSSILHANGAYYKTNEMKSEEPFSCQEHFMGKR